MADSDRRTALSIFILSDGKRSFWDLLGPATWKAYWQQLLKGNFPGRISGDIDQQGGDILIDRHGEIKMYHVGTGPADRPTVESILNIVTRSNK